MHPDPALTSAAIAAAEADGYLVARSRGVPGAGPHGRTLADVLVPEDLELVPAEVTAAVLGCITLTDDISQPHPEPAVGSPVITTRAQFSYGPHAGARPKVTPEFVGAANRAARRRSRLAALDAEIGEVGRRRAEVAAELGRVEDAIAGFDRAQRELPSARPAAEAREDAAGAARLRAAARARLDRAKAALDAAVAELDARARRLRRTAADRGLPASQEGAGAAERATADFEHAAGELVRARADTAGLAEDLGRRRDRIRRLSAENEGAARQLEQRRFAQLAEAEELGAREAAAGSEYAQVSWELEDLAARLDEVQQVLDEATELAKAEHDKLVRAQADTEHGSENLATAMDELLGRARAFGPYAQPSLRPLLGVTENEPWPADSQWPSAEQAAAGLADRLRGSAAPEVREALWAVLPAGMPAVLAAFTTATRGGRVVTEGVLTNAVDRMWSAYRDFENALKAGEDGYQPDVNGDAPFTVDIATGSGRFPVAAFARKISEDAENQRVLLEERERTVLEDSLLTSLARQIHSRVIAARDLVTEIDADMRSKPMSSGTAIGIRWVRADNLTERAAAVSQLLDRDVANLGPDRLTELRGQLRAMIHEHRARNPRDTYREALAGVLDYRAWHAFELRMLQPGQPVQRLTRKRHSEMSGGEKSAAIHLPLFAAANALYSSSKPECPRLIALDEAFAGIDDRFRPELLGLTVRFDLDLFMTGHDLWVTYPTVPMIAHYDMRHDKAAHTVSTLLALWEGGQLTDAGAGYAGNEDLASELLGIRPSRHVPADAGLGDVLAVASAADENDEQDDRE